VLIIKKVFFVTIVCVSLAVSSQAQTEFSFLDKGFLFKPIILDATECQAFGTLSKAYKDGNNFDGLYIPIGLGLSRSIFRWKKSDKISYEIRLEAAAFSQFEINDKFSVLGNLVNTDYKASIPFIYVNGKNQFRFRIYHNSSHFGDDYLLTNKITSYIKNPANYEQIDFMYSWQGERMRYYVGMGYVFSPNTSRERLSAQVGLFWTKPFKNPNFRWVGGLDLKCIQQSDYYPNTKAGIGIQIGKVDSNQINLMLELYNGKYAYSLLEKNNISWIGAGMYFIIY
jgi:Protein of unknown function (DUF1207)